MENSCIFLFSMEVNIYASHPKVSSFGIHIEHPIFFSHCEQMGGSLLAWMFCNLLMQPFQWSLSMAHAFHPFFGWTFLVILVHGMFFCLKFEGGPGTANDVANTMMQKFWNSALALEPPDEDFDSHRSC